jgi:S1-C subfamily serine protease
MDEENPFINTLFDYSPGDQVVLTVVRDGEEMQLTVTLGDRADL